MHSLGAVHKDLAARNCLVSADETVRIGDFGLSRVKFPGDYYAVEGADDWLPVRWMAPETFGSLEFTKQSDVWSAGVLMWEISTHGNQPFAKHSSSVVAGEIQRGGTQSHARIARTWQRCVENSTCLSVCSHRARLLSR
jgi:serine/threonine protein kinase